jgi:hypothetical protein
MFKDDKLEEFGNLPTSICGCYLQTLTANGWHGRFRADKQIHSSSVFSESCGKNLNAEVKMCRVTNEAYIELD